jgi:hypothetical protein
VNRRKTRNEAAMKKPGDAPHRHQLRRGAFCLGLVAGLALAVAALAEPAGNPGEPPSVAQAGSTSPPAIEKIVTPAAAPVLAADAKPVAAVNDPDGQQRRLLMLLLMNSAGPLGTYGTLGR